MQLLTKDIAIYESGNGGDIAIINNDIAMSETLFQQAYLAMFGGNVAADTQGNELPSQVREDWWGNSPLFNSDGPAQFNSQTERAIAANVLNSAGRINIQRAVEADLSHLSDIAVITVTVSIPGAGKLKILVKMTEPGNKQITTLQALWDNAKNELIINKIIT